MDVMAKVNEIVDKVQKDPKFKEEFKKDPVKAVESVIGVEWDVSGFNGTNY